MDRRKFIKNTCVFTMVGSSIKIEPHKDFIKNILSHPPNTTPYNFSVWEDDFQNSLKKMSNQVDKTIQSKLLRTEFEIGELKNGKSPGLNKHLDTFSTYKKNIKIEPIHSPNVYEFFDNKPSKMTTPVSNLNYDKNRLNSIASSQSFRPDSNYLMIFAKNDISVSKADEKPEYILIHPIFNEVICDAKWFCYGYPIDKPMVSYCDHCRNYYFTQIFCYQSNDPIYGKKTVYNSMIGNAYCNPEKKILHKGVTSVNDLVPCKCYDNIKPLILNNGNLDEK